MIRKIQTLFIFILLLFTYAGCTFISTAAGSFVGNLGADYVIEKKKETKDERRD